MKKILLGLSLLAIPAAPAFSQPPGFGRPHNPPLSPYLNLLNDNNSDAFNYYQLYRPQAEFRSAYQDLNRNLYKTQTQVGSRLDQQAKSIDQMSTILRPGASLSTTGHPTSFMSYGNYFGSGGSAAGRTARR